MPADTPTPLATFEQLNTGAFADLVRDYDASAQTDLMIEATRQCESVADRRLVAFTLTESHRATGVDPDEYADSANLPLDIQGTIGRSYAMALGATTLVRHVWLNEYAPRYPEFWSYTNIAVKTILSYGGSQDMAVSQLIGPEPDSGHLWFQLGTFLPIGSMIRVTYSGGYTTVPADLVRAGKYMAASIAVRELDPTQAAGHDPDLLYNDAVKALNPYMRT
ncbi:MAG: hypothetical protein JWO67_3543 [Streptosporangiaceae bacterium]|nr:hypothetical protein [Streptosporangiaceae bacterium]